MVGDTEIKQIQNITEKTQNKTKHYISIEIKIYQQYDTHAHSKKKDILHNASGVDTKQ